MSILTKSTDPEVSALSTLSDVQNSLFIPNLGKFVDRTRELVRPNSLQRSDTPPEQDEKTTPLRPTASSREATVLRDEGDEPGTPKEKPPKEGLAVPKPVVAEGRYLVLPEGLVANWEQWTDDEKEELDDYVRHLLHSRKWKARRSLRGFRCVSLFCSSLRFPVITMHRRYVRTPLGAFITIYAALLTFWGASLFHPRLTAALLPHRCRLGPLHHWMAVVYRRRGLWCVAEVSSVAPLWLLMFHSHRSLRSSVRRAFISHISRKLM